MTKTAKWVLGITLGVVFLSALFFLFIFSLLLFPDSDDETLSTSGEKIAIIELNEPILSSKEIVRQFKKYRENKSVKAVLFRVDSPGGGVSASQEIYEEVRKTREEKPVVVSMGSVAASGGYYVSCGASKIVANPGTLTGSIGVIFQFLHFNQLMEKIGVDASTFKTGKYKDIGSPFRPTTADEQKFFDQLLADVYHQFVDVIVTERKMEKAKVLKYADGRVFTGRQAHEYGFVDTLGTFEDALGIAADLAGIEGKPRTVQERKRRSFFQDFFGEAGAAVAELRNELLRQPILQYRYDGF
jgi:protease-4